MLPEKSMSDVLVFRVKIVEDDIGIARVTGSKDYDLEIAGQVFEDFKCMRTNVDAAFNNFSCRKSDGELDIAFDARIFIAMNQGLV